MVILSSLIAMQTLSQYKIMLNGALNIGVTPIEVKEIVYQAIPYVGIAKTYDFIDATNECIKVATNNKLTSENMEHIVRVFSERCEEPHFSHLATYDEIANSDYSLAVSAYVDAEDTREKVDIVKLNAEIEEIVLQEAELREAIRLIISDIEGGL